MLGILGMVEGTCFVEGGRRFVGGGGVLGGGELIFAGGGWRVSIKITAVFFCKRGSGDF